MTSEENKKAEELTEGDVSVPNARLSPIGSIS